MARSYGILICLLIMLLDVVAGILGIEAELAENLEKSSRVWIFECRNPSHQAFERGLAAAILLLVAHAIANILGGCFWFWSKEDLENSHPDKTLAVGTLILSWMALATGFSLLIIGTLHNARSRKSCGLLHCHVLSIGGIVCFFHGMFAVAYYVSASAARREEMKLHHAHSNPVPIPA